MLQAAHWLIQLVLCAGKISQKQLVQNSTMFSKGYLTVPTMRVHGLFSMACSACQKLQIAQVCSTLLAVKVLLPFATLPVGMLPCLHSSHAPCCHIAAQQSLWSFTATGTPRHTIMSPSADITGRPVHGSYTPQRQHSGATPASAERACDC